jgi:transcriptional regulator with XRE-family HTH domain
VTAVSEPAERRKSSFVALRQLAALLAALRTRAGLSQADVARELRNEKIGRTKLHLIESGDKPITANDLDVLLGLYQPPDGDREHALGLAEAAIERGWWDDDPDMSAVQKRFAGLEWGSRLLRVHSGSLVASLLQTPAYITAVLATSDQPRSPEQLAAVLEARRRRRIVLDDPDPLDYRVVMDEAALLRPAGPASVMAEQLLHVVDVMNSHPSVDVRIVPFSAGIYPGTVPPFTVLTFEGNDRLVYLEPGLAFASYLDDRDDMDMYSRVFERLYGMALGRGATLDLLQSVATNHWAKEARHEDR